MLLRRMAVGLCLGLGAWGCGEAAEPVGPQDSDGGGRLPDAAPAGMCKDGDTQACSCPASGNAGVRTGTQTCYGGQYYLCNCNAPVIPSGPTDTSGSCLAGRYEGSFMGEYRSGFALGLGIDVQALDFSGMPGLAFVLEEQISGSGGEFQTYTITSGYLKGTANGVFPFEGILTGTLDCETKKFTGELNGYYVLGFDLAVNKGMFKGPVVGVYDGTTHAFTLGTWDVLEENVMGIFGTVGGNGSWEATWKTADTSGLGDGAVPTTPAPDASTGATDAGLPDAGP